MGACISLSTVSRAVKRVKHELDLSAIRYEIAPGQQAQADWTDFRGYTATVDGYERPLHAFFLILRHSRMRYVEFVTEMTSFLNDFKRPNVLLRGLADQGREKIAIGVGDAFCRAKLRSYFISYDNFIKIIRTHGVISGSNKAYNELMKKNCLIIDNFAEKTVYDEELLDEMAQFIQSRADAHRESYIQHKHNPQTPFVPCCTIVTSSFEPADWTNYMKQDDKKTYNIARFFCDNYAVSLHVDENNTPANAE